jgi:hypothetical protein
MIIMFDHLCVRFLRYEEKQGKNANKLHFSLYFDCQFSLIAFQAHVWGSRNITFLSATSLSLSVFEIKQRLSFLFAKITLNISKIHKFTYLDWKIFLLLVFNQRT